MTRETRIGLLVGLAFIVMFGLVLGELTKDPDAAPAAVERAQVPEVSQRGWLPPIAPAPARQEGEQVADVRGPADPVPVRPERVESQLVAPREDAASMAVMAVNRQETQADAEVARGSQPIVERRTVQRRSASRTYTVQPGDMLRKIARKVYGPQHEEQYTRIFEANRDALESPALIQVGQELIIPPLPGVEAPAAPPVTPTRAVAQRREPTPHRSYREMDVEQLRRHFSSANVRRQGRRVYVVRQGDNLTRIAREMLHDDSPAAVRKLYKANRDRLENPDVLPVGVELVIPSS